MGKLIFQIFKPASTQPVISALDGWFLSQSPAFRPSSFHPSFPPAHPPTSFPPCLPAIIMDSGSPSRAAQRNQRLANIRGSLASLSVLHQTTAQLQVKLEKNRSRKPSAMFTDKEMTLSKVFSDIESDEEERFHSLFKDKYTTGDKIGEGAHGVVRHCIERSSGRGYAVKTFCLDREHILFLKKNFSDIRALKHEHIIGYRALFFEMRTETCHLVMEYLPFPDLLHLPPPDEQLLKELVYQLLDTLAFIHHHRICHRDIKPENVLYDRAHRTLKLIDFGISKKLVDRGRKKEMLTLTGTPYYRAPEMFEGGGYDERVDLWALGVTMFKLMTGVTPFESEYHSETIANIMRGEYAFPPEAEARFSKSCRNLVSRLLKKRAERLTAEEAMRDMWFIDLHKAEQEPELSLSANVMFNCLSAEWNNNSLITVNNLRPRREKEKANEKTPQLAPGKSFKDMMNIEEEESMIYGCEEATKKSGLSRERLP